MSARVFCEPGQALESSAQLVLSPAESHYLVRVRRLRVGDDVEILDGISEKWSAKLVSADAKHAVVELARAPNVPALMPGQRTSYVALPDSTAALEVVEIATVLHTQRLVWLRTKYSQTNLPGASRLEKAQRAGMRQSGQSIALDLSHVMTLEEAIKDSNDSQRLLAWETQAGAAEHNLSLAGDRPVSLWIGPEGGFTQDEAQQLLQRGATALSLGPHILRTPLALAAMLARVTGDRISWQC